MNNHLYLPNKQNRAYSPIGVQNLFKQAEKENDGNLEAVFNNKHKYKNLIEMYHAGFLALSLYKWLGKKFLLVPSDTPDLFFIEEQGDGAFPLEVMELYRYKGNFQNYKELADHIWAAKGGIRYEKCQLLLASRMSTQKFNISKFVREIEKFQWSFERIWLSIHNQQKGQWTFFDVFPPAQYNASNYIYFNLNEDKKFWY